MNRRVAVIDIGSNSIKALVAESDGTRLGILPVYEKSLEVRISKGISGNPPVISEDGMQKGVQAVEILYAQCQSAGFVTQTKIVATSAVRCAANGVDFMNLIEERTGVNPIILSGQQEADAIAFGVRTDPAIYGQMDHFTVFDLGGGSLELIRFEKNHVVNRISLPLGSVRLTEQFISNPHSPVLRERAAAIQCHIMERILETGFPISEPLVGCSGGLTTWRTIRARRTGRTLGESSPVFSESDIDGMISEVVFKTLKHRIIVAQIPPERADIYPVALLTFRALMELAGAGYIQHSLHNLRYGIAWQLLQAQA